MRPENGIWREIYKHATNSEVFFDSENIRSLMLRSVDDQTHDAKDVRERSGIDTIMQLQDWRKEQSLRYRQVFRLGESAHFKAEMQQILLRHTTVMASALGCWLQGMSAPGVFEDTVQLKLMTLLACDVGVGKPEASRHDEFKTLLRRNDLSAYAIPSNELHSLNGIKDRFFMLPALLLAMSRRSDEFAPELCGVDLCLRTLGLFPCWEILKSENREAIDWNRLDLGMSCERANGVDLPAMSAWVVENFRSKGKDVSTRIDQSIAWCIGVVVQWNQSLLDLCKASLDPERAMAVLVQERAREGSVYHQNFILDSQTLATWFKQAQDDPMPFVRALGRSRLVLPGRPDRSVLINGLVASNGPMFRVFSREDINILRRWINHLGEVEPPSRKLGQEIESAPEDNVVNLPIRQGNLSLGLKPGNIREAYFLLQGRALAPKTRGFAIDYIEEWLECAQSSVDREDRSLPREWTPGLLREWLLDRHDRHGEDFKQTSENEVPSRDEVINSALQLAPLTLIDGAWLQGFTDCQLASSRIGFYLFETYWDELGNGRYDINHPKIYRDVLRQMGIELPPTGSRDFAFDGRFDDTSFRLPVYWLCLGKLPMTFMATILGMNLAMELSGVGGSYRSAHRFLKYYGFSTLFVDIHNTIDNISTGHSAWAAHAIDTHMQKISGFGNDGLVEFEWNRVRVGYESLNPLPSRKFNRGYSSFSTNHSRPPKLFFDQAQLYHHSPIVADA